MGPLALVFTGETMVAAEFQSGIPRTLWGRSVGVADAPPWAISLMSHAFQETLQEEWCLLDGGYTGLEKEAMSYATQVPFGTMMSYGGVARLMGKPNLARTVGRAMRLSPTALFIPTHRVVRADGRPVPCQRGGMALRLREFEQRVSSSGARR